MRVRDFLDADAVNLELRGTTQEEVLAELVSLLRLGDKASETVLRQLLKREAMGTTGFGNGIAIPHCRTLAASRLRVAFGRHVQGVNFTAVDGKPVHAFFLIVAPTMEVSNQYLPILGRLAQVLHDPGVPERLRTIGTVDELFTLIDAKGL
jgi:mannitol/fructose-specific phosphotransferase system IIA component (Ntr-type)